MVLAAVCRTESSLVARLGVVKRFVDSFLEDLAKKFIEQRDDAYGPIVFGLLFVTFLKEYCEFC